MHVIILKWIIAIGADSKMVVQDDAWPRAGQLKHTCDHSQRRHHYRSVDRKHSTINGDTATARNMSVANLPVVVRGCNRASSTNTITPL